VVGIAIKEVGNAKNMMGGSYGRIPVSVPEGKRSMGAGFCVNIADLNFYNEVECRINTANWSGYPFVSMKR
jgi:hypothetical protein